MTSTIAFSVSSLYRRWTNVDKCGLVYLEYTNYGSKTNRGYLSETHEGRQQGGEVIQKSLIQLPIY